jgi:CRISPR-associated endonuclease/helicase Cas3
VSKARDFQATLESDGVPTLSLSGQHGSVNVMHHSRYALPDRKLLDQKVLDILGKQSESNSGVAIVGTQSLEQSLDIDADYLVTDLCPIEVLLQRLGRLFRNIRTRPFGYEAPQAFIISPKNSDDWLSDEGMAIAKHLPQLNVYRNALHLEATRQLISELSSIVVPDENRGLVEMGTHPDRLRELATSLGQKWLLHLERLTGLNDSEDAKAKKMLLRWNVYPDEDCNLLLDNMSEVYTRLGCDTISVRADFMSFSGQRVSELSVRANELGHISKDMKATIIDTSAEETVLEVGESLFRYDRTGLSRVKK